MEFNETQFSQFLTAVNFSAHKHRDQRRKGADGSPYINHPIIVAELLWRVGHVRDMNTLVAAILHDTIEDTETQPEEIESLFGSEVLALVQECTDDKSLPKAERKRLQILNASHKSTGAKQIKLADKTSNVEDVMHHPPADWNLQRRVEYLDWAEQVVAGLKDANAGLTDYFADILKRARQKLETEKAFSAEGS
jgi:GTP diphosphokinase / guanosine-3',5'-bis(diphosphate) 3'-diphosphatase